MWNPPPNEFRGKPSPRRALRGTRLGPRPRDPEQTCQCSNGTHAFDSALNGLRSITGLPTVPGALEALRIAVEGSPVAPRFELTLANRADRRDDEREIELGDIAVLVAASAIDQLDGATVDFVERVNESEFEVRPRRTASRSKAKAWWKWPAAGRCGRSRLRPRCLRRCSQPPAKGSTISTPVFSKSAPLRVAIVRP